jgi:hypothetical protein
MSKTNEERELLFELIKKKYGDRLEAHQLEAVKQSLERVFDVIEEVRSVPLKNSDEPFSVFKPFRRD